MPDDRFSEFQLLQISFDNKSLIVLAGPNSLDIADNIYYRFIVLADIQNNRIFEDLLVYVIGAISGKTNIKNMNDLIIFLERNPMVEVFRLNSPNAPIKMIGKKLKFGLIYVEADPNDERKFKSDKYNITIISSVLLDSKFVERIKRKQG